MAETRSKISRRAFARVAVGAAGAAAFTTALPLVAHRTETSPAVRPIIVDAAATILSPTASADVVAHLLEQMKKGGVSCVLASVATTQDWPTTMANILAYTPFLENYGLVCAKSASQIESAHANGGIAVVYHCRGSFMLASPFGIRGPLISTFDVKRISTLHELGVRVMQLTDDFKGYIGDGCTERTNCGLTDYGIWAIKTMNDVGILVDCSHAGYRTSMEAIEVSRHPVIFSHSNAKALCPSERNISDEQIRAVAVKGGVIGISTVGYLVHPNRPTLEGYLDHVDYITKLVGVQHVGMGFDYSSETAADYDRLHRDPATYPKPPWTYAVEDWSRINAVVDGLRARKYDDQAIHQILGGNFVRVFRQVWKS